MTQAFQSIETQLPSDLANVSPFVDRVCEALQTSIRSPDTIHKVRLCLEEALTNAMRHGNRLDPNVPVQVSVTMEGGRFVMDVRDRGNGFDPASIPDPTSSERSSLPSGRGVYLMRSLTDSLAFYDGGRGITMTIAIP